MKITRNNYEEYAISYLEGEMTPSEVEQFIAFLLEHPDLAEEIDSVREFVPLDHCKTEALKKVDLKKDINSCDVSYLNFDEYCIAWYEKDLNDIGQQKLSNYILSNRLAEKKFTAYGKLYLKPDTNIIFSAKKALKKNMPAGRILHLGKKRLAVITSIAASVILLFSLIINYNDVDNLASEISTVEIVDKQSNYPEKKSIPTNRDLENIEKKVNQVPPKQILVVDNSKSDKILVKNTSINARKKISTSKLDSKLILIESPSAEAELEKSESYLSGNSETVNTTPGIVATVHSNGIKIFKDIRRISFDRVLQKSVTGINQMTETDIKYQSETDDDGNITAFSISSESFNIKRVRRN